MNRVIPFFFLLSLIVCCTGNNKGSENRSDGVNNVGTPELVFTKIEHDFGNIVEGEKVGTIFSFINSGEGDLVIASASTSCGCTIPKFSDEPVPPGANGTVEVVFDSSNREGKQTKTVTIRSNASTPVIILRITADIVTN